MATRLPERLWALGDHIGSPLTWAGKPRQPPDAVNDLNDVKLFQTKNQ